MHRRKGNSNKGSNLVQAAFTLFYILQDDVCYTHGLLLIVSRMVSLRDDDAALSNIFKVNVPF